MHLRRSSLTCGRILSFVMAVLVLAGCAFATTETVVHSFGASPDGAGPDAGLVADSAGNLYGITSAGGAAACSCGAIFELNPPTTSGGAWSETILYSFQGGTSDGARPVGTMIFDKAGNLYGTTTQGGTNNQGTVFELSPPATAGGAWTETVLWIFNPNGRGGSSPAGLAMDAEGDLFGTGYMGGAMREGVVWELLKPRAGFNSAWVEKVLYSFGANGTDGANPGPNIIYRNGVIYGTTLGGGVCCGTVFQLVNHSGVWTESILYRFTGVEGFYPQGGVILDSAGNLYGALYEGGPDPCSCGAIYELSPPAVTGDAWTETTLYTFTYHGEGGYPAGGLWRNSLGDLFGTATGGGIKTGVGDQTYGTVFKLKAPAVSGGTWIAQPLHDFAGLPAGDGSLPFGQLTLVKGLLYGTAFLGGNNVISGGGGAVFSVVP